MPAGPDTIITWSHSGDVGVGDDHDFGTAAQAVHGERPRERHPLPLAIERQADMIAQIRIQDGARDVHHDPALPWHAIESESTRPDVITYRIFSKTHCDPPWSGVRFRRSRPREGL
ncbi:hypothetical protein ABZW11_23875 [Nonomuraea sp. NPDC004580]|uniref:hypothetical protein n=1 Tax=Nonomuraea sp. NPDC004580 TaxID=3154552 RepID=UPI0033AC5ACF